MPPFITVTCYSNILHEYVEVKIGFESNMTYRNVVSIRLGWSKDMSNEALTNYAIEGLNLSGDDWDKQVPSDTKSLHITQK
jgi:hypothetical protein